jgi:hypothetical protein
MWDKKKPDAPQVEVREPKNLLATEKSTDAIRPLDAIANCEAGWLGSSLHVKGEITGSEDLLIDGTVEGLIQLDERKLTVGTTAKVTADINARDVVVYGYVRGNVRARGRIEIKKDGSVNGADHDRRRRGLQRFDRDSQGRGEGSRQERRLAGGVCFCVTGNHCLAARWRSVVPSCSAGESQMPPLEEYLEHADDLPQHVVDAWGVNVAFLTTRFKVLVDKACLYKNARRLADNHRDHNVLSEEDEAEEKATREAFAVAYKAYYERHAAMS